VVGRHRRQPAVSPEHREGEPFLLWGHRGGYGNIEVAGTEHRQAAVLALLPRSLRHGADLHASVQLLAEPTNPFDRNAVGCWRHGRLIGYLPRDEAARYVQALTKLIEAGHLPTTTVRLWARRYDDNDIDDRGHATTSKRYYTSARIGLAEPHLIAQINSAPLPPRADLPDGSAAKIIGTQDPSNISSTSLVSAIPPGHTQRSNQSASPVGRHPSP
jgi:hypothetical protein